MDFGDLWKQTLGQAKKEKDPFENISPRSGIKPLVTAQHGGFVSPPRQRRLSIEEKEMKRQLKMAKMKPPANDAGDGDDFGGMGSGSEVLCLHERTVYVTVSW